MTSRRMLIGSCWAQVVPTYSTYWNHPTGVKIAKITQRKPRSPEPGCLLIRIRLEVPEEAFVPAEFEQNLAIEQSDGELVPALTVQP